MPTSGRLATALLSLIALGALGGCGSGSSSTTTAAGASRSTSLARGCRAASAGEQIAMTATHVLLLHIGPEEAMVMPGDVKARHPSSGEVMLGGSMSGMSPSATSGPFTTRHLEVRICARASGNVVMKAMPSITLARSPSGRPEQVPVMVMEGARAGAADLHYGNNVPLNPGASYIVTVRLGAERAVFRYRLPSGA
jgi:hypothetical protein